MTIPNIPRSWDWGPFLLGWIFILYGFDSSNRWAFFAGILLIEFGLLVFVFVFLGTIFFDKYSSDTQVKNFVLNFTIVGLAVLFISSLILGHIYFGFDPRLALEAYRNNLSFKEPQPIIDVPNVTWNWIQNLTHQ